jgi:hypothetical protein
MKPSPQWPDVFIMGDMPVSRSNHAVCADALEAWALVMSGTPPLPQFGNVMAMLANRLGVLGTPDSFLEWKQQHPLLKGED